MIMPWVECNGTSPMISQHWLRSWRGAIRQQAITWANVDLVPCHHMASPGHNKLTQSCYKPWMLYFWGMKILCKACSIFQCSMTLHHPFVYVSYFKASYDDKIKSKWTLTIINELCKLKPTYITKNAQINTVHNYKEIMKYCVLIISQAVQQSGKLMEITDQGKSEKKLGNFNFRSGKNQIWRKFRENQRIVCGIHSMKLK